MNTACFARHWQQAADDLISRGFLRADVAALESRLIWRFFTLLATKASRGLTRVLVVMLV